MELTFLFLISFTVLTTKASEVTQISYANDKFSSKLYDTLAKGDGNLFYSPISVHAILSLLQQGAVGETAQSMQNALNLPDSRSTAVGYKTLMEELNSVQDVKLHIANKVYVHQHGKLKDEFSNVAKNNFLAEAENVNFAEASSAARSINDWVENKTNKKITDLISPDDLDSDTRMVLVNAIYFKGDWLHKFQTKNTNKEKFYLSETDTADCDMMHINRDFEYADDEELDAQIVVLPYKNTNLSLTVILPNSKTGIKDLERKLKSRSLSSLSLTVYEAKVDLYLPKFKIETKMDLNEPLKQAGFTNIFSDSADFTNLLDSPERLKVSKVVQKAFIEVNEEGAEAAAATGISVVPFSASSPKPIVTFKADHPFIFMLTYRYEEIVQLFVGKLNKPSVN